MGLYHTTDMYGISELNPSVARMDALIEQLDAPDLDDAEHPDVALVHDASGWAITLYPSGIATLENFDHADEAPRYLSKVTRDDALLLWRALARGEIETLLQQPWQRERD